LIEKKPERLVIQTKKLMPTKRLKHNKSLLVMHLPHHLHPVLTKAKPVVLALVKWPQLLL
jgi:hypothetical protein